MNAVENRHPIELLADDFVDRYRRGEKPSITEYKNRYPELAKQIDEVFPALAWMEQAVSASDEQTPSNERFVHSPPPDFGDFRIIREIGRGGMGVVYEAEQESLGRRVALKVLPNNLLRHGNLAQRFEREARAAAKLHHTNIVPVFGVGQHNDLHYYVMQFIDGQSIAEVVVELQRLRSDANHRTAQPTLATAVTQESAQPADNPEPPRTRSLDLARSLASGQFAATAVWSELSHQAARAAVDSLGVTRSAAGHVPPDTAIARHAETRASSGLLSQPGHASGLGAMASQTAYWQSVAHIGIQTAQALQYAHEQGVVHRDIKPANLLLDIHGTVWVTDFGLAKSDDERNLTATGDVLGTLRYMAPEQFEGKSDGRTDVYALGLTLYELLALQPAFDGRDRLAIIKQVASGTAPPLRDLVPHLPRDLEVIVQKAIEREPGLRYQTARELEEDLQRYLQDEPILARRTPPWTLFGRWCRRNRTVAALCAGVAVLLVIGLVGASAAAKKFQALAGQKQVALDQATDALKSESAARRKTMQQLFDTSLVQARASRSSGRPGQRLESLAAAQTGASLLEPLQLGEGARLAVRNEAIGAMTQVDVRKQRSWHARDSLNSDVVFSDDLQWFCFGDADTQLLHLRQSGNPAIDVAAIPASLTPNNSFLQFGGHRWLWNFDYSNRTLRLVDLHLQKEVRSYPEVSNGTAVDQNLGSNRAIFGDLHGNLHWINLATLDTTQRIELGAAILAVRLDAAGKRLAISRADGTLDIRNAETGRVEWQRPGLGGSNCIAWSSDGALLAVAHSMEIHLVEVGPPPERAQYFICRGHQAQVTNLQFHPTQPVLASSSWDGTTRFWDAGSGHQLLRMVGNLDKFSRDGRRMALRPGHDVEIWEFSAQAAYRWLDKRWVSGISVSPDGRLLAACYQDGVRMWDLGALQPLAYLPVGNTHELAFNPRTNSLATAGPNGVWEWPLAPGQEQDREQIRLGPPQRPHAEVKAGRIVHWSGDGNTLLAEGLTSGEAALVQRSDGGASTLQRLATENLWCTALSPDGKWAVAGDQVRAKSFTVWNARTGEKLRDLPCNAAVRLAFSPDNRRLVTHSGTSAQFWRVVDWKLEHEIDFDSSGVGGIAFSPDSRLVAFGVWGSGVRLYDADTAAPVAILDTAQSPPAYVDLEFTPDGRRLIGAADSEGICIWELNQTRHHLAELGLDWKQQPLAEPIRNEARRPLHIEIDMGPLKPRETPAPTP